MNFRHTALLFALAACVIATLLLVWSWLDAPGTVSAPARETRAEEATPPREEAPASPAGGAMPLPGSRTVWTGTDPADHAALPHLRADISEARLVALDRALLAAIEPGEWVDLVIPQMADPVTVQINDNTLRANGVRVLHGRVEGRRQYPFVATLGKRATYATIGTRAGIWNLRGSTDLAWVIDGRVLNEHVDPAIPDYLVPDPPVPRAEDGR